MPPIFKALASIAAWILFIVGCVGIILPGIIRLTTGEKMGSLVAWGLGIASLTLSVVVMKLRKSLE
jgi:hypothetical protein